MKPAESTSSSETKMSSSFSKSPCKHVRGDLIVRLGNFQVANIFTDGPWKFRRNWLRRNDRNVASLAWRLANDRQLAGLGGTTVPHQLGHEATTRHIAKNNLLCKKGTFIERKNGTLVTKTR